MGLAISINATTTTPGPATFMNYNINYEDIDPYSCVSTTTVVLPADTSTVCLTSTQALFTTEQTTTTTEITTETTTEITTTTTAEITTETRTTTRTTTSMVAPTATVPVSTTASVVTQTAMVSVSTTTSIGSLFTPFPAGSIFIAPTCSNQSLGPSCNFSSSPCTMSQPCLNLARCFPNISIPIGYVCTCVIGYFGVNCEVDKRSCRPGLTCLNGGICNTTANETTCTCPEGKVGDHCEYEVDICANVSCQNAGQCVSRYGNWSCRCTNTQLYSGTYCQTKSWSLRAKEIVSRSFAGVAIGCLSTVVSFFLIMDVLKYCFDINPADNELQSWKDKKNHQRREARKRRERERNEKNSNQLPKSVVAVRFTYIDA